MNRYIATNIFQEVKNGVRKICCPCSSKICAALGTSIVIPATCCLQFAAKLDDEWASSNNSTCDYDYDGNCSFGCSYDDRICMLVSIAVAINFILLLVGCVVCCRGCCGHISGESYNVCCVCMMSMINLLPGILSLCCCFVTVSFVSEHHDIDFDFGFSFYAFAATGSATIVISSVSVCGFIYVKSLEFRRVYQQIVSGSDDADADADAEAAPILNT